MPILTVESEANKSVKVLGSTRNKPTLAIIIPRNIGFRAVKKKAKKK